MPGRSQNLTVEMNWRMKNASSGVQQVDEEFALTASSWVDYRLKNIDLTSSRWPADPPVTERPASARALLTGHRLEFVDLAVDSIVDSVVELHPPQLHRFFSNFDLNYYLGSRSQRSARASGRSSGTPADLWGWSRTPWGRTGSSWARLWHTSWLSTSRGWTLLLGARAFQMRFGLRTR